MKVQVNHMRELCFLPMVEQYKPVFVDTIDELIQQLGNYDKNA